MVSVVATTRHNYQGQSKKNALSPESIYVHKEFFITMIGVMLGWTRDLWEQAHAPRGLALIDKYLRAQMPEKGTGLVCLIKG